MKAKLIALLVAFGSAFIGGKPYRLAGPDDGVKLADLRDAGIGLVCSPALLECQVRIAAACRVKPDGGLRLAYATVEDAVYVCPSDAGDDFIVANWPTFTGPGGHERLCFEPAGSFDSVCRFTDDCADGGTACAGAAHYNQDRCACRASAGVCRTPNPDGGVGLAQPFGVTIQPPFSGAGCVAKSCEELNGDQGQSWPSGCPP